MTVRRVLVKKREYSDSVRLMQLSATIRGMAGVVEAILMMATDNNRRLLDSSGLLIGDAAAATANDLVIAVVAADAAVADEAIQRAEAMLREKVTGDVAESYRTLDSALQGGGSGANVALISVPGQYAASEAQRALERGLHVMLFSDNVTIDDEVALKRLGLERGLLVMGPDCGTAILNGVGLGFSNVVRRGPVGIVGASGTGIQEISVLIDRMGSGVSHAIGTGGRDLKEAVGGLTMLKGIDLLDADPTTRVIVVTSKPPAAAVAQRVVDRLSRSSKPVVINFLGSKLASAEPDMLRAGTLEEAATFAVRLARGEQPAGPCAADMAGLEAMARSEAALLAPSQQFLRGLFAGGTLGYEALLLLSGVLGDVRSNIPLRADLRLSSSWKSEGHTLVDLGDDEFTQARAHPMIDPTLRRHRLIEEADDPRVAVILLDIVLGFGSHANPAGSIAAAVQAAKAKATAEGRHLVVVAAVCGTAADSQGLSVQEQVLRDAGVLVLDTNARAARLAGLIARYASDR